MLDLNGAEIKVGDHVVYAASGYNHSSILRKGIVQKITARDVSIYQYEDILVIKPDDGGRAVRVNRTGQGGRAKVMVL